jgi:hypothetical protein
VPSVREFLERLRPSGTPGAPSAAGVPVDRVAEVAAELRPLFDALDSVQADAERIRQEATDEAKRIREDGTERARALLADATQRAGAERAAAAAAVEAKREVVVQAILESAQARAREITANATARMPAFESEVQRRAWDQLLTLGGVDR